jgi:hypothetical protein
VLVLVLVLPFVLTLCSLHFRAGVVVEAKEAEEAVEAEELW